MSTMYKEEIALCCKQLRLSSNLVEQAMSVEGATNQEYLYHVLSNEVDYRRRCRISKLLSTAGFPRIHTFPQFKSDEVVFQSDCSVERLEALEFRKKGFNIIMYGGTGTGKTMLSICIGIRLCEESIPAVFFRTASLVNLNWFRCQGHFCDSFTEWIYITATASRNGATLRDSFTEYAVYYRDNDRLSLFVDLP